MMQQNSGFYQGRCFKLGDDIPLDNAVMPVRFAVTHEFDPSTLLPHLFEGQIDNFATKAKRGDLIIAGKSFCSGKPHPQGLIAMAAIGVGILCESMPFQAYRGAVSRGVPCNRSCAGVTAMVDDGDRVEMDFATGQFRNVDKGFEHRFPSIESELLRIMINGGMHAALRSWREGFERSSKQ